jgi:hypothetical protein
MSKDGNWSTCLNCNGTGKVQTTFTTFVSCGTSAPFTHVGCSGINWLPGHWTMGLSCKPGCNMPGEHCKFLSEANSPFKPSMDCATYQLRYGKNE